MFHQTTVEYHSSISLDIKFLLSCHSSFAIMDFTQLINNYKENDFETSSPIWIKFTTKEENDVVSDL